MALLRYAETGIEEEFAPRPADQRVISDTYAAYAKVIDIVKLTTALAAAQD